MLAETPLSPEGDNMLPTGVVETNVFTADAVGEATGPWPYASPTVQLLAAASLAGKSRDSPNRQSMMGWRMLGGILGRGCVSVC